MTPPLWITLVQISFLEILLGQHLFLLVGGKRVIGGPKPPPNSLPGRLQTLSWPPELGPLSWTASGAIWNLVFASPLVASKINNLRSPNVACPG